MFPEIGPLDMERPIVKFDFFYENGDQTNFLWYILSVTNG